MGTGPAGSIFRENSFYRTRSRNWTLASGSGLTTWRPFLVLYPEFLDKTNFPRLLTRRARYPQVPSTIPRVSRPWTLPGSNVVYRCWGHPAQVSCAYLPSGLDKTNFPRKLNPRGAKGTTIPTTRTRSHTWTLTSAWATRGSELRLTTWRPPSSCTPGFSIKRIFVEYWSAAPGTHRTLLHMIMLYHKSSIFYRCLKRNYIKKCFS